MNREPRKPWRALLVALLAVAGCCPAAAGTLQMPGRPAPAPHATSSCPLVWIEAERLPDLAIPRSGHYTCFVNGEPTVMGGHTTGFLPTPTAEYYSGGKWHVVPMTYTHDNGCSLLLRSGKVLLVGGHNEPLGIGQTFPAEYYLPAAHRFTGFGCLEMKRSVASAVELDSGRVLIAGNWYAPDSIELFDGKSFFHPVKSTSAQRSCPFMLQTSAGNAVVFGAYDTHGDRDSVVRVDRLHGEPFTVPLFEKWKPMNNAWPYQGGDAFIGDRQRGRYDYLFVVADSEGQIALARMQAQADSARFALLPTSCPIPMESPWGKITYLNHVVADTLSHRAYVLGCDRDWRIFVLCADYGHDVARLTLYHTDPLPEPSLALPVLTADGDLMMAGGSTTTNFSPYAAAYVLRVSPRRSAATPPSLWAWVLLAVLLLMAVAAAAMLLRRRSARIEDEAPAADNQPTPAAEKPDVVAPQPVRMGPHVTAELMERIDTLMTERRLYLNATLKVSDVAVLLDTNSGYVSDCIKQHKGSSFSQYVNAYRIDCAKQIMREQPDKKMSAVCIESGFSNETSFFRTFKSFTGMTPREWKAG